MKSWNSLNPQQKFKRFKNSLWLLVLAIIVVFVKLDFWLALGISVVLLFFAYLNYKKLKQKADYFDNSKNV